MAPPPIGARLSRDLLLDEAAIRAGATLVGDENPLHHDADFAAASRYGGLIASGAHTAALLAGMLGSGFQLPGERAGPQVGVEYSVRFRGPVRPGRAMRMEWVVEAHEPRRRGTLVRLAGRIVDTESGAEALTAELAALYFAE